MTYGVLIMLLLSSLDVPVQQIQREQMSVMGILAGIASLFGPAKS